MPDYPATGKRMLQDDGSWLACPAAAQRRARAHRHRAHRARRRRHRRRHASRPPTSSATPPASATTTSSPDGRHRPRRRVAARAVGRRADRVPRHHDPELPEPVLPLRAGHEPRARREPVLPLRVPGPLRDGGDPRASLTSGARSVEVRREVHDDYADAVPGARSASSCGRTRRSKHSHYKNPEGKVFTLSPWPLDLYREWTNRVHGDDYAFG